MANPIQREDIITDDAYKALENMATLLTADKQSIKNLMKAMQSYADSIKNAASANSGNNEEMAKLLKRIEDLEKAYADLQKTQKENLNTQKALAAEKRKYAKLTNDEKKEVIDLTRSINRLVEETKKGEEANRKAIKSTTDKVNAIDVENKSYNELQQTYNALKDALNRMTTAERNETDAGKLLTAQALKVRDTMNELQKATGNYTLQVGKYRAAFDGLGYSFQQILREAPSALNLNQFFLAISNNIPQFLDQLSAFKKEQAEIQENLKGMTKGTADYEEQLSKVETVGQKLGRTLLSWQTGVLVLLMIIRKIDWKKLGNNIRSIFKGVQEVKNEISATVALAQLFAEVTKKVADEATELDLVVDRLKKVKQGSEEWRAGVATVNKLTKENLNTTTATIKEVEKVTEAYKKQAEQVAKNGILADMIAKSEANKVLRQSGYSAQDASSLGMLLGIKADSKDYKEMEDYFKKYAELRDRYIYFTTNPDAKAYKTVGSSSTGATQNITLSAAEAAKDIEPFLQKAQQELDNFINNRLPILSDKAKKELEEQFELIDPLKTGKNGRSYSLKDVDFLESELLDKDAVIELESNYERRLAMLAKEEEKERQILLEKYKQESEDLEFNREKHLITEAEYQEQRKKLDDNYKDLIKTNYEGNFEEMGVIQRKYWNKRNEVTAKEAEREEKEALKRDKKAIKDIEQQYEGLYKSVKKRVRTVTDERAKNEALISNIHTAADELARLNELVIESDEDASGYTKRIAELTKQMEQWRNQMDFSKELALPGSFWELLQKKGAFDASPDTMKKIVGKFLPDMVDEMDEDQIESAFETITKNIGTATKEWYNTTIGYIQDLISAYVELANAKAEAAAEATEAAQEEYDKEKALLEAGYASRVEATWAEYQEKKAAQEKAEADAKAAAQTEKDINEALTMGNLVSASAKIWEAFAAWPPVAVAALGTMWGSFAAAKIKAAEVSKYGEGGFEVLEGGSHASGHDIDLGIHNRRGRRMRAEGDEGIGIFSRKAMRHYGAESIEAMVNSVNRLEFEGNAAKRMNIERSIGMAVLSAPRTDLRRVESSLDKLVQYGSRNVVVEPDGSILEYRKNGVVRIKKA